MNGTALYRALVDAGTSEERAKEAAESVLYAREGATRSDVVGVQAEVKGTQTEVAELKVRVGRVEAKVDELKDRVSALEATMERSFRAMTFRLIGAMFAMQALMLAGLKLTA